MNKPLIIYAGHEAWKHIRTHGLNADDISMLLGASSGPKWLVLHGIDDYLMRTFFANRTEPLHLLGTSAGAWRMACYAQTNNVAAHQRLTNAYIEQSYSKKPSGDEVLSSCRNIIDTVLGARGVEEILSHPYARMHLITSQCHGLAATQYRPLQAFAFLFSALLNVVHRKTLGLQFTRVLMHHHSTLPPLRTLSDLPSRQTPLNKENLSDAVLSTGCIPVITKGVRDVAGKGLYHDGGITDYGFDLPFLPDNGYVLYPHFAQKPVPGWFDKSLKWRKPKHENYARTIMLVPSQEFLASLPYGKMPDRNDFVNLRDEERIPYWRCVVERTKELTGDLATLDWKERVQVLPW